MRNNQYHASDSITLLMIILLILLMIPPVLSCQSEEDRELVASGTIEAVEVTVGTEVMGQVRSISIEEGDDISAGTPLCQIDDTAYRLRHEQAKAARDAAQARLELLIQGARQQEINAALEIVKRAEANLEEAELNYHRMQTLFRKGAVAQQVYDRAKTAYQVAQTALQESKERYSAVLSGARAQEIAAARSELDRLDAIVEESQNQLSKTAIYAPIDGVITSRLVEIGEILSPGAPLAVMADLSNLYIRIYLNEINIGKIKLQQKVEVYIDAFPEKSFPGTIVFISPEAEFTPRNIQTKDERVKLVFGVKIALPNPDQLLKVGLPADVRIEVPTSE